MRSLPFSDRTDQRFSGLLVGMPTLATASPTPIGPQNESAWGFLQYADDCGAQFGWGRIGWHVLLVLIVSTLVLWPFARLIAGRAAGSGKCALFIVSAGILTAAFLSLAYLIARSESLVLLAATGIAWVAILFTQTRHLFAASRGAAAAVLGCAALVIVGTSYGIEFGMGSMPWTQFALKPREEKRRAFDRWLASKQAAAQPATVAAGNVAPALDHAEGPIEAPVPAAAAGTPAAPPAPPRVAPNLDALYAELQKARAELNVNDPVAVAHFNEQAAAYDREKAMAGAVPGAQPAKARIVANAAPQPVTENSTAAKPSGNSAKKNDSGRR
jgi:hypothetical protein